jgi:N-acetylneuraminic acid mutarotase
MSPRGLLGAGVVLVALALGCIDVHTIPASASKPELSPDALDWRKAPDSVRPPAFQSFAMAALGDEIIVVGSNGLSDPGSLAAETWAWNGRLWSHLTPASSPPPLASPAMATLGAKIVLFGSAIPDPGRTGPAPDPNGQTWEWYGATWTRLNPPTSPPARSGHAMATLGDKIVLFGGHGANDTWEWNGVTWTLRSLAVSPPPRERHAMVTLGGQVVLFGGTTVDGVDLGDLWTWNGSVWAEQAQGVSSPGARGGHAMAALGNNILLVGGGTAPILEPCVEAPPDAWQWDGATWTVVGGLPWHSGHAMATLGGKIVLFGGQGWTTPADAPSPSGAGGASGGPAPQNSGVAGAAGAPGGAPPPTTPVSTVAPVNDTWEWDGQGWLQGTVAPPGSAMVSVGGKALLIGDMIWEWDGATWTPLGPSSRSPLSSVSGFGAAFATRGDKVVLFGGYGLGGDGKFKFLADTWEWDGTSWRLHPAQMSPPGRMGHALAALGDKLVMFGGSGDGTLSRVGSDTWEWDGATWTQRTPPVSPPARSGHSMVSVGDRIVLMGGQRADGSTLNDTWQWDGSTWTPLMSPSSPSARSGFGLARWNNTVVLFGGGDASTHMDLHDTWALTGSTWTQLTPATYPPSGTSTSNLMATGANEIVLLRGGGTWLLGPSAR